MFIIFLVENQHLILVLVSGKWRGGYVKKNIYIDDNGYNDFHRAVDNELFFRASDDAFGTELWKSDGTEVGTIMVKDIAVVDPFNPYHSDSDPYGLINVNGVLFFVAEDNNHGYELWKSDGNATGTVMIEDIDPGQPGGDPYYFASIGNTLYFVAEGAIWKSDGTSGGTEPVVTAEGSGFLPVNLTNVDDILYFTEGYELWKYDENGSDSNDPPYQPNTPIHVEGSAGIPITAHFYFTGGDPDMVDTVTYDVYLSANNTNPDILICDNIASTECQLSSSLAYSTTYSWKVVATDSRGAISRGPVWSFTTEASASSVHSLIVSKNGQGTVTSDLPGINCGIHCSHSFNEGDTARLTAVPRENWSFTRWSGACTGDSNCMVEMNGDKNVFAIFTPNNSATPAFPWAMFLPAFTNEKHK